MFDRKSSKRPVEHVKKYLKLVMNSVKELKDESYIQVLKQIKEHKDYAKAIRGWNFFAIIASCYVPSKDLFYSILRFLLDEIRNNSDKCIVQHANYVFARLYKTSEIKRVNVPNENEILYTEVIIWLILPFST